MTGIDTSINIVYISSMARSRDEGKTKVVIVELPGWMKQGFSEYCKDHGITMSYAVRRWLGEKLPDEYQTGRPGKRTPEVL